MEEKTKFISEEPISYIEQEHEKENNSQIQEEIYYFSINQEYE